MKNLTLFVVGSMSIAISGVTLAQTADRRTPKVTAYSCDIVEYVSESSDAKRQAIPTFRVEKNREGDPIPAEGRETGHGNKQLVWKVTRYSGMISVEVAEANGEVLTISTTKDGFPIGVKIPSTKNILSCNPPQSDVALGINPRAYGESMSINPRSYGSTIQIIQQRNLELLKRLLEESKKKQGSADKEDQE